MNATENRRRNFSLDGRCWSCGGQDLIDGVCRTCDPATQIVPTDPDRGRVQPYRRKTVFDMLARLHQSGEIEGVDHEIAALATEAMRLLDMGDLAPKARELCERDRTNSLRKTLEGIVKAKEHRQRLLESKKAYLSIEAFRVFVAEVERVLRKYVRDPSTLAKITDDLGRIRLAHNRTVRADRSAA